MAGMDGGLKTLVCVCVCASGGGLAVADKEAYNRAHGGQMCQIGPAPEVLCINELPGNAANVCERERGVC